MVRSSFLDGCGYCRALPARVLRALRACGVLHGGANANTHNLRHCAAGSQHALYPNAMGLVYAAKGAVGYVNEGK